jgi:GNAT superfamily N-acetyltransferase
MARRYTKSFREIASLRDGRRVVLRLLRSGDEALLKAAFERLSPESRYRRFHGVRLELGKEELDYLTNVDGENHFALCAIDRRSGDGLGVARFVRSPQDPTKAEAAFVVTDDVHRQGLGRLLLTRLAAAARERGVVAFRCTVLGDNDPARRLLSALAPGCSYSHGGGVVEIDVPLPEAAIADSQLYRLFIDIAAGALVVVRTASGLWGKALARES